MPSQRHLPEGRYKIVSVSTLNSAAILEKVDNAPVLVTTNFKEVPQDNLEVRLHTMSLTSCLSLTPVASSTFAVSGM